MEDKVKRKKLSKLADEIIENNEILSKSITNEEQVQSLGHRAWKLRVQGNSYHEIANILGMTVKKVKHCIAVVRDEHKMEIWADVEEFRQDLVMQLQYMANETQKLWEDAKRSGDPVGPECISYLESSRKMMKDIRDVMGLDAPKRTETQVSTGEQPYTINIDLSGATK